MPKSWEMVTRKLGLEMGGRLNIALDPQKLVEDWERVAERFQLNRYKDGAPFGHKNWNFISLVTLGGKYNEDKYDRNWKTPSSQYVETEAMRYCPYIKSVFDDLGCRTHRVRILSMEPGGMVAWHHEYGRGLVSGLARCHIPIKADPKSYVQIGHQQYSWPPGEIWWGDFAFPHCGINQGDAPRTYIVADIVMDDAFKRWVPQDYLQEHLGKKKKFARSLCYRLYKLDRDPTFGLGAKVKGVAKKIFPQNYAKSES